MSSFNILAHRKMARVFIFAIAVTLALLAFGGCTREAPAATKAGIEYEVSQGLEVAGVSWYLQEGFLQFDVKVKNVSSAAKKIELAIKADNAPEGITSLEKPLDSNKEAVLKVMILLEHLQPANISIKVNAIP